MSGPAEAAPPPWGEKYPAKVPRRLEVPNLLLTEMFARSVERWGRRPAVVFYGRRWSYRELGTAVERFASALVREGVRPGDRVALVLPNCPAYPIAFFGTLRAGATVVQVSPLWVADDLEAALREADVRAAVTLEIFYPTLRGVPSGRVVPVVFVARLRQFYPWLARPFVNLFLRRDGRPTAFPKDARVRPWSHASRAGPPAPPVQVDPARAVAVLQGTGGTTGTPKAAMLTHRNLVANVLQADAWNTTRRPGEEVFLAAVPLFHIYGLTVAFLLAIYEGGTIVFQLRPEPGEMLRLIGRYRPTQLPGVPALYAGLVRRPELPRYDLRSIRFCVSGSAPLPPEVQQAFEARTGGSLLEGYGLTEASPVTHVNPVEGERRPGSIGVPVPETEQRVVDPERRTVLPAGEVGELEVRGPQVMAGYFRRPEESRAVLSEDGWLRTGDLARIDPDGYAYLVDRLKDVILVGGLNVYPGEVEAVLRGHPAVAEVAVVGAPDPVLGEVPRAYVVLRPGATATADALIDLVRGRLAHYKAPRAVEFRAQLPKSPILKVLRRQLREEARRPAGPP